jgi:hypothetical protein
VALRRVDRPLGDARRTTAGAMSAPMTVREGPQTAHPTGMDPSSIDPIAPVESRLPTCPSRCSHGARGPECRGAR